MLVHTDLSSLIDALRSEATDARQCFRSLSIQAIAFAVGAVAGILIAANVAPVSAFGSLGVFLVVVAVQRIGIHKLSTSNRLYGYQLHLERLCVSNPMQMTEKDSLAWLGWEEACRAWRIVQATVFDAIYVTPKRRLTQLPPACDLLPGLFTHQRQFRDELETYRSKLRKLEKIDRQLKSEPDRARRTELLLKRENYHRDIYERGAEFWWLQRERSKLEGAQYHAGSYLARMLAILGTVQLFSLVPMVTLLFRRTEPQVGPLLWGFAAGSVAAGLLVWVCNLLSLHRRRQLLEEELLSIHSCAIMWKAVALAHVKAWGTDSGPPERRHYTERLARIARWYAWDPKGIRAITDMRELPDESLQVPSAPR